MNTKPRRLTKRTEIVSNPEDKARWIAAAKNAGQDLSQWVRETLNEAARSAEP